MNTNSIAMWETLPNNADWYCFKTPILQEILRIQNLHQVEHCAFWEVIRLFQSVGCVRNKLQFRTVQQNLKSFLWMQDWGWMVSPHLINGIWSSQFLETRIRVIKHGETCVRTNVKFVQHLTEFKNERNLMEWSMIWIMLILPSNVTFLTKKHCCMCLKTTKQWSRWLQREEARQWDMFPGPTGVALDWLFDRINLDTKIQIKYIDTKNQLADILTKGNFTRDEWNHLLCLFNKQPSQLYSLFWSDVEKNAKKIQAKKESQQNRSRWWIWSRDAAKGLLMC